MHRTARSAFTVCVIVAMVLGMMPSIAFGARLSPSLPIEPDVVAVPLRVESDPAITTIANSIGVAIENIRLFDETQRLLKETEQRAAEQARFDAAIAQREMLVKEVHHRIKNNLQGVAGLLQQNAARHPEVAGVLTESVGQVQAIAQVYGLQVGSSGPLRVVSMLEAIALSVQRTFGRPMLRVELQVETDAGAVSRMVANPAKPAGWRMAARCFCPKCRPRARNTST